ncbi:Uncharacterised protein [Mycobacterium tuberculosis]|nr:Uncharacterised protein [Mycobacterium tuberculosis]
MFKHLDFGLQAESVVIQNLECKIVTVELSFDFGKAIVDFGANSLLTSC